MTTLYLLRHGETGFNATGRIQGHLDIPLNEVGQLQARLLGQALSVISFSAIYASDLSRAMQTAQHISAHHQSPIFADRRLREASLGDWEGHSIAEVAEQWPAELAAWRKDSLHNRPSGGETLQQVQTRAIDLTNELVAKHPKERIALVGHGGSIRAIIAFVLQAELTIFPRLHIDNCAISIVQITPERATLFGFNDICHLKNAEINNASADSDV